MVPENLCGSRRRRAASDGRQWSMPGTVGGVSDTARTLTLTAAVTDEGDWWVARCVEVEVTSQGRSEADALNALAEALALYFEDTPVPTGVAHLAPVEVALPA